MNELQDSIALSYHLITDDKCTYSASNFGHIQFEDRFCTSSKVGLGEFGLFKARVPCTWWLSLMKEPMAQVSSARSQ